MDCSPPGSSVNGDSPGENTGVGFHALLQGIFPTQGSNSGLQHYRQILYCLSHQGRWLYSQPEFGLPRSRIWDKDLRQLTYWEGKGTLTWGSGAGEECRQRRLKWSSHLGCGAGSQCSWGITCSSSSELSTQLERERGDLYPTSHHFLLGDCSQGCSFSRTSDLLCRAGRAVFSGFGEHPKPLRKKTLVQAREDWVLQRHNLGISSVCYTRWSLSEQKETPDWCG